MFPSSSRHRRLLATALLGLTLLTACRGDHDARPVDCSDACTDDCHPARGFDLTYQPSCQPTDSDPSNRFCSPLLSTDHPDQPPECTTPDVDLEELTIDDIHTALQSGDFSCQWLTESLLARTLWLDLNISDDQAPLNSIVTLNQHAIDTAQTLDDFQRCEGELAGPLHCIPFVIKTNYSSREVPVTAGSLALMEAQPDFDAFTVERMRRSGAILMGSATMDEFARGAMSLSGRSGKTGNAYNRRYNSGGSSSGSAVAVSANFALAGFGTDNCSSLTIPAAFNGLATLRSSFALVSTDGLFPSNPLDVIAGPMTRTVEDLARILDVVAAFNPHDPRHCSGERPVDFPRFTDHLSPDGLQNKRIGVLRSLPQGNRNFYAGSDQVRAHYDAFFQELEALGAEIIDPITLPGLPTDRRASGMGPMVDQFLARTTGGASTVEALCESELYSHSTFDNIDDCIRYNRSPDALFQSRYQSGLEVYESNRAYVTQILDELNLDALVYPADAHGIPRLSALNSNCILASITGLPTIVVPTGYASGLPIGMSFTGRFHSDPTLFEIASAYEFAYPHRTPPLLPEYPSQQPPPLDLSRFNDLHFQLGHRAWLEVLRDHPRSDLTHTRIRHILDQLLQDEDLPTLR